MLIPRNPSLLPAQDSRYKKCCHLGKPLPQPPSRDRWSKYYKNCTKMLLSHLDPVVVIFPNFRSLIQRLKAVFDQLQNIGLKLNLAKCDVIKMKHGMQPVLRNQQQNLKIAAIQERKALINVKKVLFLETVGYYRQCVPDFATTTKPLTSLVSMEAK